MLQVPKPKIRNRTKFLPDNNCWWYVDEEKLVRCFVEEKLWMRIVKRAGNFYHFQSNKFPVKKWKHKKFSRENHPRFRKRQMRSWQREPANAFGENFINFEKNQGRLHFFWFVRTTLQRTLGKIFLKIDFLKTLKCFMRPWWKKSSR